MNRTLLVVASLARSLITFRGDLLTDLVKLGWRVHAVAPDLDRATRRELEVMGVDSSAIRLDRSGTNVVKDTVTLLDLMSILWRVRPDVVLAYTMKPVLYSSLAARTRHDTAVVSLVTGLGSLFMGSLGSSGFRSSLRDTLFRVALRSNRWVVFQNPDDRARFENMGIVEGSRTRQVAGSGVNLERFPMRSLPSETGRFLMIARLLSDKGVREYARAAEILRRRGIEAQFDLVGPVEDHPRAVPRKEVEEWVDSGILRWYGAVDDVRPYLAECSVYVLPSYREGTPRSVLEAMATGRPVITTDAPGCRETVVEGVNGHLVRVGDAEALADAMATFVGAKDKLARMGEASRRLAGERFDVRAVNAELIAILDSATTGKARGES